MTDEYKGERKIIMRDVMKKKVEKVSMMKRGTHDERENRRNNNTTIKTQKNKMGLKSFFFFPIINIYSKTN